MTYVLRFAVRLRTVGVRGFQGDDIMSVLILLCYTVDAIATTVCYLEGTNVDYTAEMLSTLTADQLRHVVLGSKMELLAW